jgi:hypothetical protein
MDEICRHNVTFGGDNKTVDNGQFSASHVTDRISVFISFDRRGNDNP